MEIDRLIVYKLGTTSIVKNGGFDLTLIDKLVEQFIYIREDLKIAPVIVCSGSIDSGRRLESLLNSQEIVDKQAAAMIGQPELTEAWRAAFSRNKRKIKINVGEALLKDEDICNFKKPALRASQFGVVIVNGPDATYDPDTEKEIISTDNDRLARHVACAVGADTLGYLTEVEGILDKDRRLIEEIGSFADLDRIGFFEKTTNGTGGPQSKLLEARKVLTDPRMAVYIACARAEDVIIKIARHERVGTRVTLPYQRYFNI